MLKDRSLYFDLGTLLGLLLSVVLFTGCGGVMPGSVAGEFGPSIEDTAVALVPLWQPAPYPAAAAERWRCEVGWRCYATDPDTRKRTELLRSGTAWYEDEGTQTGSSAFVCADAKNQARDAARCSQGVPHYEELEIDRDCSCRRL